MVKGNHDQYYIYCYENKVLNGLASEFIEYINFMKENTNPRVYGFLKGLPYSLTRNINGKKLTFKHFAWKEDLSDTESLAVCPPRQEQIESLFKDVKSQYVFYGHTHFQHSINIKKEHMTRWYINFGPLGTPHANQGIAKFGSVEIDECGEVIINNYALDYDVTKTKSKIASLDNSYVGKIIDKFFSN
jgi:predicted phosphodiesterase